MKAIIESKEFKRMLGDVNEFQKGQRVKEISVKLETDKGLFLVSAFINGNYIEIKSDKVKAIEDGFTVVEFNKLYKAVKSLSNNNISIESEGYDVKISDDSININFDMIDTYIVYPEINPEIFLSFDTSDLVKAMERIIFICYQDRKGYDKSYMFIDKDKVSLLGADMYAVGNSYFNHNMEIKEGLELFFDNKDLKNVYSVLKDKNNCKGDTKIHICDKLVVFKRDNITMIVAKADCGIKNIKDRFEDMTKIKNEISINLDRAILADSIKKFINISKINGFNSESLKFHIKNNKITISDTYNEINIILPFETDYDSEYDFILATNDLQDILKANTDKTVYMVCNELNNKSLMVLNFYDSNTKYIVVQKQE